jgi:hypothetical protein
MQILAPLIRMPSDPRRIPLPWYHRGPLGFLGRSQVFVTAVSESSPSQSSAPTRPADIVVSVLGPDTWSSAVEVHGLQADAGGLVLKSLETVKDWNIALAETVSLIEWVKNTHDAKRMHEVNLICEPVSGEATPEQLATLREALRKLDWEEAADQRFEPPGIIRAPSVMARVSGGWAIMPDADQDRIGLIRESSHPEHAAEQEFDLTQAVVSADLQGRFLRFVTPRRGACTITLEHDDKSGVLMAIVAALHKCEANILSLLLRRGGVEAAPRRAVMIAVCEPSSGRRQAATLKQQVYDTCLGLRSKIKLGLGLPEVQDGVFAESLLYAKRQDQVLAECPPELRDAVIAQRTEFKKKKRTPVFLGRRFIYSPNTEKAVVAISKILELHGCEVVQAAEASQQEQCIRTGLLENVQCQGRDHPGPQAR